MIRVGLVGAGPWASMFTAPMLASAEGLSLAGIWARRADAAEELAGQYGVPAASSFEDLLDRCDAVAFNVPAEIQAQLAIQAARAGKHLLLEKPIAFTVADAKAVAAAVDEAGVATQLMLTYRFTPQVRTYLAELESSRVDYVQTAMIGGGALGGQFATPWRRAPRAALLDVGPHSIDLTEQAAGTIVELRATEVGGAIAITTHHDTGAAAHIALSGTTPNATGRLRSEAVTDAGQIALADPTPWEPAPTFQAITEAFVATVQNDCEQAIGVHRGVRLQHLIAAVTESIDTNRAVKVEG